MTLPLFEEWKSKMSKEDLLSLETLCFHLEHETRQPYSRLLLSAELENAERARPMVERAYESVRAEIERADMPTIKCLELFTDSIVRTFEAPGCIPGLVSGSNFDDDDFGLFERNIQVERGGAIENAHRGQTYGLTWDNYYFLENVSGSAIDVR
jgi:hypothetical protein